MWGNPNLYYKLRLPALSKETTQIDVVLDGLLFGHGYVLQRTPSGEMIQISHINNLVFPSTYPITITRGFNGTAIEDHPADGWMVVVIPYVDHRSAEEKRRDREPVDYEALVELVGEILRWAINTDSDFVSSRTYELMDRLELS